MPAHGKWNIQMPGYFTDQRHEGLSALFRGSDVQKDQLVGALLCIKFSQFDGITGVTDVHKINTFYSPAIFDVQAGNDPFFKHKISSTVVLR